jgi:hypothetical protein
MLNQLVKLLPLLAIGIATPTFAATVHPSHNIAPVKIQIASAQLKHHYNHQGRKPQVISSRYQRRSIVKINRKVVTKIVTRPEYRRGLERRYQAAHRLNRNYSRYNLSRNNRYY